MVRLALVTSVTCRPVSFQISQLSMVPKSTSPRSARSRSPSTFVEQPAQLRRRRSRWPAAGRCGPRNRSSPYVAASSRSERPGAGVLPDDRVGAPARPVARSQTRVVSRWLVMPTAASPAGVDAGRPQRLGDHLLRRWPRSPRRRAPPSRAGERSAGARAGRRRRSSPARSKTMHREEVVPWSMAATYWGVTAAPYPDRRVRDGVTRFGPPPCRQRRLRCANVRDIAVFSGSAHPELAAEICAHLGVPLHPVRVNRFANDCLEVQLQANCRERDVFLIQPLVPPVQEHLVELLLMIDAARGASAGRITVVMPHYAYARSDKKDAPRISIGGRLVADLLVAAGAEPGAGDDPALAAGARLLQRPGRPPARAARAGRPLPAATTCPTPWWSRPTWATPRRPRPSPGCSARRWRPGAKQRFADDRVSDQRGHRRGRRPGRHRAGRRDRQGQHGPRAAGPPARAEGRARSGSPARTACSPPARSSGSATSPTCWRSSAPTRCRSRPRSGYRQAAGAVGRPGAGRGDAPDPQRRVGLRPVRLTAPLPARGRPRAGTGRAGGCGR